MKFFIIIAALFITSCSSRNELFYDKGLDNTSYFCDTSVLTIEKGE